MSRMEQVLCRSGLWNVIARRIAYAALGGTEVFKDVLEIGGGSGAMAESIVLDHPGCQLTVIDFDPVMVAAARQRLTALPNVSVQSADATKLPFEDAAYDTVLSFLMLHHVIDWEAAVTEASRVLRPGGTFSGYDLTRTKASSLLHKLDRSPHRLIAQGEFEKVAEQAGVDVPSVQYSKFKHIMSFTVHKL
ncbi:class I SAM-dependent methyltransferase [Arthrobacter roseus]|uniref:class I SAM-dependent methyltransferase n=1 Tax=Arthrobacter roseus TaxID=136274 RepID=UPI001964263C|nr:class I SAM-dependent methyltransferase [Arthrobacter roseus]MBM7847526.1 ubiquinone/menaquinone biosynthesis C-methylase UbiE [Arthrobacter roseus]